MLALASDVKQGYPMKKQILRVFAAGLLVCLAPSLSRISARAATGVAKHSGDRTAITEVLAAQQAAWNKGDIEAFLQGYWRSPELTFSGSNGITRGWDGVLARYKQAYPDRATMGHSCSADGISRGRKTRLEGCFPWCGRGFQMAGGSFTTIRVWRPK
jgi:hypothetical protein